MPVLELPEVTAACSVFLSARTLRSTDSAIFKVFFVNVVRLSLRYYGSVRLPVLKAELISLFPQLDHRGITDGVERGLPASVW
jgi:hypothetical protein